MSWSLIGTSGKVHPLPQSMVFVGREDCDITSASRSVDKRHAVINYDNYSNVFTIKDIGSLNGTFINEARIREQTYVNLARGDRIRFGYDPVTYRFDQDNSGDTNSTHQSKESKTKYYRDILNSLKQEEMTNGSVPSVGRTIQVISPARGSPLYGLPDWWGEKDLEGDPGVRPRTGTFGKNDKEKILKSPTSAKSPSSLKSPTSPLASSQTMTKRPTDLKPTVPVKRPPTPEDTEVTMTSTSDHHVGFTIEFGTTKETAPKLSLNESLSAFMPSAVKTKINESVKIVEELKAERKQSEIVSPAPKRRGSKPPTDLHLDFTSKKKSNEVASPTTEKTKAAYHSNSKKEVTSRTSASPSHLSVPGYTRRPPLSKSSDDLRPENENHLHIDEDHLSDTGTYTIESENPSMDLKRAREQIDDVFGVAEIDDDHLVHGRDHLLDKNSGDDTDNDVDDMEDEDGIQQTIIHHQNNSPAESGTPLWISKWASNASSNVHQLPSNAPDLVKTTASSKESNQVEMLTTFCITSVQIQGEINTT
ncbi:centrosomal protein of 170 kDa protein B-like isoform X2 [Anneissia japonica]|uniref:centrosomal protein of 170 kDa protein B-like isoform X2 n=1 Tax=Anneissia japonica TaxID=1529436 RepID=UPI001425B890|nr:centrosomal protein of 170 kDa protein B-like isoform X2 [Anneissia japonica]